MCVYMQSNLHSCSDLFLLCSCEAAFFEKQTSLLYNCREQPRKTGVSKGVIRSLLSMGRVWKGWPTKKLLPSSSGRKELSPWWFSPEFSAEWGQLNPLSHPTLWREWNWSCGWLSPCRLHQALQNSRGKMPLKFVFLMWEWFPCNLASFFLSP